MSSLMPIQTSFLRDRARASLRSAIVSGVLAPGAPVVIDDLAAAFELSTMPVREAVKRLVAEGLIEELPRRAHRVAPLTRRTALNVLDVMETLMVRAYELGTPRLAETDVAAMRRALDAARRHAAEGDLIAAVGEIGAMHAIVYAATGNPEFERALSPIASRFDRVLLLWYTESITDVDASYRRVLVEALERGDRLEAVEILRDAWRRFRDVIAAREDDT